MNTWEPSREQLNMPNILEALSNPLRLEVAVRLARSTEALSCGEVMPGVSKSTASHHLRILRESGVVSHRREGRYVRPILRREDLNARFPGLLDAILANSGDVPPAS
ncbi:helix-turn-helix domain-containing protein [Streptomyces sp. ME01-24h]|nr:helix-turn-helix domain-containing protein [Streptomyces sp. ME19-03-3]MDX3355829.1 helix-turn-helix domain-containing protein [Streptomyces sp. ME01-24h]